MHKKFISPSEDQININATRQTKDYLPVTCFIQLELSQLQPERGRQRLSRRHSGHSA